VADKSNWELGGGYQSIEYDMRIFIVNTLGQSAGLNDKFQRNEQLMKNTMFA